MSIPITPLADRVIAQREAAEAKTASGLYLPDNAKEKPAHATVRAVGPKVKDVKVGDQVVFREYSTSDLKINGEEYLIVKEEDILAKLS